MPEYVMSAAGDDNAVGTAAAPFRTIERGIQKLSGPGDVLVIRGGVYPERMNLICKKGDANAPIQIRGEAGGAGVRDRPESTCPSNRPTSGWPATASGARRKRSTRTPTQRSTSPRESSRMVKTTASGTAHSSTAPPTRG
jgi:hypothetical protein